MILSRHAEALFWAGRYLERAEITTRQLDIASRAALHAPAELTEHAWLFPVRALGLAAVFAESGGTPDEAAVSQYLLHSDENPGSVASCVAAVRDNLRVARERVPVELWEETSRLHLRLSSLGDGSAMTEPSGTYGWIRHGCQAVGGVISESMTRDEGHAFLVLGRNIERSVFTTRMLIEAHRSAEPILPDQLLRCTSSLQAFHRLEGHGGDLMAVTDFLLHMPTVPRTVRSCIEGIQGRLDVIGDADNISAPQQLVGRLRSQLLYGDIAEQLRRSPVPTLEGVLNDLTNIAETISESLFYPSGLPAMTAQFVRPGRDTP